jgi:DNA (cytosine-5)-methyltransferase 1
MDSGVAYIDAKLPKAFLFENVKALTFKKHARYFKRLLKALRAIIDPLTGVSAYEISFKVLNTNQFGLPHSRPRVFIVGTKISTTEQVFKWPIGTRHNDLEAILGPINKTIAKKPNLDSLAPFQIANLMAGIDMIVKKGGRPLVETWFIDIHASKTRVNVRKGVCPCLTKSRAGLKGFWVSNRGCLLTTDQMLALQGIMPGKLVRPVDKATEKQFDCAIGNAVSVPVLKAILANICKSIGYI